MKRMLINATQPEELRVAIVDGQRLQDLDIEHRTHEQKKSNVYKGIITRIEPSLEAAFVDYGSERHGFLPFKEIARSYLSSEAIDESGRPNVKEGIKEGLEVVVQVEKEERGNKGAALTTMVSLAGRYLVLMPNKPRAGGISRRVEGDERAELRDALNQLAIPTGMGTIIRTAGVGRSVEELQWDLDYQAQIWEAIQQAASELSAPLLIYQESNVFIRALRDNFRNDIGEILIDESAVYSEAKVFMERYMPQHLRKLKLYDDATPLFSRFQIESQIESAFQRKVFLPSGGSVVLDHTEALFAIDINSARATKGEDIEETALTTNLEAAAEIARQLRLRDVGGLLVIDFIDMLSSRNQREVEKVLREHLKLDRARVQLGRISRFGLLEMSRQRLRPSLGESSQRICPRCQGQGSIRTIESLSLAVLRILEEEALKEGTRSVVAKVPVEAATYLLNEKRENITAVEQRLGVNLLIVPSAAFEVPHYEVERIRKTDRDPEADTKRSYELGAQHPETYIPPERSAQRSTPEQAVVNPVIPAPPPPAKSQPSASSGWLAQLWKKLFGGAQPTSTNKSRGRQRNRSQQTRRGQGQRQTAARNSNGNRRRSERDNARHTQSSSNNRSQSSPRRNDKTTAENKSESVDNGNRRRSSRRGRRSGGARRNDHNGESRRDKTSSSAPTDEAGHTVKQDSNPEPMQAPAPQAVADSAAPPSKPPTDAS